MRSAGPLAVGLVLLFLAPGRADEAPARAAAVLDALQSAVHDSASPELNSRDLLHTPLVRERVPAAGRDLYVPRLPPHCGLTAYGGLDVEEGTALVRRLFATYGYVARPGFRVGSASGDLELDGFDEGGNVGFLILPPALGGARAPVPEVDPSLLLRLRAHGRRVLVLPLARYRASQGDSLSPLLAVGLSAVEFLNDVASGPDVDVRGLASDAMIRLPLPDLEDEDVPSAPRVQVENGHAFFVAATPGTLDLDFRAPAAAPPAAPARPLGPSLLILPWYARTGEGGTPPVGSKLRFTLRQGATTLPSRRPVFVLPPAFDPSKPFRLRIEYPAGQCYLGGPVLRRGP